MLPDPHPPAGFMLDRCPRSCPKGCPHPLDAPGPKASAVVRDAWQREDLGAFVSRWSAHLVEPHAARVVTVTFMDAASAKAQGESIRKAQSGHREAPTQANIATDPAAIGPQLRKPSAVEDILGKALAEGGVDPRETRCGGGTARAAISSPRPPARPPLLSRSRPALRAPAALNGPPASSSCSSSQHRGGAPEGAD